MSVHRDEEGEASVALMTQAAGQMDFAVGGESLHLSHWMFPTSDVPIESLRLRFALLQSLNTTLETFFLPLVELRQSEMYAHSIAALLQEAKGGFVL